MGYQILARKWRPRVLSDVVGQEHVLMVIKNSIILNKIHHAYILFGTRGVGKTTLARLFSKALNCELGKENEPCCGVCKVCTEIEKGCFLDVIEIDAASRTKIEDTKEFLDDVHYSPSIGKFKIYLIDEIHMLSRNSLNALLKILEEPPKHVKFFLITTEKKKLPSTILSRCVQFYLRPLSLLQIFNQLIYIFKEENVVAEYSAVKLISRFACGSMRDALNLSEQAIILGKNRISSNIIREILGIVDVEHSLFLLKNLIESNINAVMFRINECEKLNIDWDYLLSDMLSLLQKIAMIQSSSYIEENSGDELVFRESKLRMLSKQISSSNVQLYYQILLIGRKELSYAPSYRMGFEMVMLRAFMLLDFVQNNNLQFFINTEEKNNTDILNLFINQGIFISSLFKQIKNKKDPI